jgi:hypothetical protein
MRPGARARLDYGLNYNTWISNAHCADLADMAYESDVTLFIKKLKAEHPDLEAEQRKGRAIWWDAPPLDLERRKQELESQVPQQAYPYQTQR